MVKKSIIKYKFYKDQTIDFLKNQNYDNLVYY
jgi:hypothetical protein